MAPVSHLYRPSLAYTAEQKCSCYQHHDRSEFVGLPPTKHHQSSPLGTVYLSLAALIRCCGHIQCQMSPEHMVTTAISSTDTIFQLRIMSLVLAHGMNNLPCERKISETGSKPVQLNWVSCACERGVSRYNAGCLPIVSDGAVTEGSKYFKLGRQPHKFLTRNTCSVVYGSCCNAIIYITQFKMCNYTYTYHVNCQHSIS